MSQLYDVWARLYAGAIAKPIAIISTNWITVESVSFGLAHMLRMCEGAPAQFFRHGAPASPSPSTYSVAIRW
jgi:hypothetical protein